MKKAAATEPLKWSGVFGDMMAHLKLHLGYFEYLKVRYTALDAQRHLFHRQATDAERERFRVWDYAPVECIQGYLAHMKRLPPL